jgi:DNA-binding response OmpR family regulator
MAKIVIVEDEIDIGEVYKALLEDSGHSVEMVNDGEQGVELLTTSEWDLLLLDIMLPKKDGLDVLHETVHAKNYKNQPIIMLTNLEKDVIVQESLESGAVDYLIKSDINPSDVVDAVTKYLPHV